MTGSDPISHPIRVSGVTARHPTGFSLKPSAAVRDTLAQDIGVLGIPSLRFSGEIRPEGGRDFVLKGKLDATVVQACVVTLAPVTTVLSESVGRRYVADYTPPEDDEAEMPEDDSIEPLGQVIDPGQVMVESLILALPDYPRAPGAEIGEIVHAADGVVPLRDADLRPFAGLAGLADKLRITPAESGSDDQETGKATGSDDDDDTGKR